MIISIYLNIKFSSKVLFTLPILLYLSLYNILNYNTHFINIGIKITVIIPATPIANPLIAPSTSPNSIALVVPKACAEVPSAIPFAIGCFIFIILNNGTEIIPPNIPVRIIATTVIDWIPPNVDVKDIPIGVVIDFAINEFIIISSVLANLHTVTILIKDTITPDVIPIIISKKYFFNKSNCLYKGTASTTVTGPKKKFIESAPIL
jgi:hypothetical protein